MCCYFSPTLYIQLLVSVTATLLERDLNAVRLGKLSTSSTKCAHKIPEDILCN